MVRLRHWRRLLDRCVGARSRLPVDGRREGFPRSRRLCAGLFSAGFTAPRSAFSSWLIGGLLLAGLCGILRLASHPPLPCLEPSDLAYYNADDSDAQRLQVDGHVVGYPLRKDGRQRLDIEATDHLAR